MSRRMKNGLIAPLVNGFVFALLFFISACHRHAATVLSPSGPQVLRWAPAEDVDTLDWDRCSNRTCLQYASLVMEGLTRFSGEVASEGLNVKPALAESLVFETPTRLVVHLKKGVKWITGRSLRAEDFAQGWRRALLNYPKNPYASLLFSIQNAKRFAEHKTTFAHVGIEVKDEDTLVIHLAAPDPAFERVLAHPVSFPWLALSHAQISTPITLGAFELDRFVPHHFLSVRRNPIYYGRPAHLSRIDLQFVSDPHARVHLFLDDNVDLAEGITAQNLERKDFLYRKPTLDTEVLVLNTARVPFNSLGARRAIAEAINRNEFAPLLYEPCEATSSVIPWPHPSTSSSDSVVFSPEHALKLFSALGLGFYFKEEQTPKRFRPNVPVSIVYSSSDPLGAELAQNLQAQWIKNLRWQADIEAGNLFSAFKRNAAALLLSFSPNPFLASQNLEQLTSPSHEEENRSIRTPSPLLMTAGNDATDNSPLASEAKLVGMDYAAIPLCHPVHSILKNPRVQHLVENAVEIWDLRDTTIQSE